MQEQSELETTIPTDLTLSSFSDDEMQKWKKKVDPNFNARRNFVKEIQLLKLELIRKNTLVQNLQSDLMGKKQNFDEKLKDILHQKQMTESVLKSKLSFVENNLKNELTIAKSELQHVQQKNTILEDDVRNLTLNLNSNDMNENLYNTLRTMPKEDLTLTNLVMMKLYEQQNLFKREKDVAIFEVDKLQTLLSKVQSKFQHCKQELQKEKDDHLRLKEQYNNYLSEHSEVTSHKQRNTYVQENFQRIKFERDHLHNEVLDLKKMHDSLKAELLMVSQSKDDMKLEVSKLMQSNALLQQECDFMSQQLNDILQKWGEAQDKATKLQVELDQAKSSREDLIERFMRLKDQQRNEFEERLIFEKRQLSTESKFMYEQEIRILTESKNSLSREKETLEILNSQLKKKCEQLLAEYESKRDKEVDLMKKLHEDATDNESKIKKAEKALNQLEIRYHEKCKDSDKVNTKLQLTESELVEIKKSSNEIIRQLEMELSASKARLDIFEKMESEMNALVDEAAGMEDPEFDESLGDVIHQLPPASAKLSFMQNIKLIRKITEMEKKSQILRKECEAEKKKNVNLQQKVEQCNNLLSQVQQPYSYLLDAVQRNEKTIHDLKLKLQQKQEQLNVALGKNQELETEKNQLINDLDLILRNRQEMTKINEQIELLKVTDSSVIPPSTSTGKLKKKSILMK